MRRDLHDGLGPTLTGIAYSADASANLLRADPDEAIRVLRQLRAATSRSLSVSSICTSFSASVNVVVETSGPTCGPVPNAGGVPGAGSVVCAAAPTAAAPNRPADACIRN